MNGRVNGQCRNQPKVNPATDVWILYIEIETDRCAKNYRMNDRVNGQCRNQPKAKPTAKILKYK